MTRLLVASAGGHLTQLLDLAPRFEPVDDLVWATPDSSQRRTLLAEAEVVEIPPAHPRDVRGVAANTALALRTLRGGRFAEVVSTGSAPALGWLPVARALGLGATYVESATRRDGPSLTGSLLARVPGVACLTQHARWAGGRWDHVGSVLEGFVAEPRVHPPERPSRAVVVLGTMERYRFTALVDRLVPLLDGLDVLWQTGVEDPRRWGIDGRRHVPADELEAAIADADVVVAHAGTGTALTCLRLGVAPVLVPRRAARGEHVDDHQVQTATELARRGLVVAAEVDELTEDHLRRAAALRVVRAGDPPPFPLPAPPTRVPRRRRALVAAGDPSASRRPVVD